jgi:hypothetical protein
LSVKLASHHPDDYLVEENNLSYMSLSLLLSLCRILTVKVIYILITSKDSLCNQYTGHFSAARLSAPCYEI